MQILSDGQTLVTKTFSHDTRLLHLTAAGHFQFGQGQDAWIVQREEDVRGFGADVQRMVRDWLADGGYERAMQAQREAAVARDAQNKGGLLESMAQAAGGPALVAQIHDLLKSSLEQQGKSVDRATMAGYDPEEHPHPETILPEITDEGGEYSDEIQQFVAARAEPTPDPAVAEPSPTPDEAPEDRVSELDNQPAADAIIAEMKQMRSDLQAVMLENQVLRDKLQKQRDAKREADARRRAKKKSAMAAV